MSILPDLKYKREIIEAELKAVAELKFPNNETNRFSHIMLFLADPTQPTTSNKENLSFTS